MIFCASHIFNSMIKNQITRREQQIDCEIYHQSCTQVVSSWHQSTRQTAWWRRGRAIGARNALVCFARLHALNSDNQWKDDRTTTLLIIYNSTWLLWHLHLWFSSRILHPDKILRRILVLQWIIPLINNNKQSRYARCTFDNQHNNIEHTSVCRFIAFLTVLLVFQCGEVRFGADLSRIFEK